MILVRRAASLLVPALLLLAAGGLALRLMSSRSMPETESVATVPETPVADTVDRSLQRRERRHVDLAPEESAHPTSDADVATPGSPTGATDAGGAESGAMGGTPSDGERAPHDATIEEVVQALLDQLGRLERDLELIEVPDDAVRAVVVPDPTSGEAREISAGAAPRMDLHRFVDRGAGSVAGTAELIGARRPALEEGDPISLTGRVLAADDSTPVVGATIVVTSTFYVRATFYDHHLREVARAVTDHEGRWTVERLNADPAHFGRGGKAYVTVTADGFAPALGLPVAGLSPGVANTLDDVTLDRAAQVLRGRVLDTAAGQPVVGATIFATGTIDPVVYPKDQRDALFVGAPTATTDEHGRFVLEGLGAGRQMISVHGGDDCVGRASFNLPVESEVTVRTRAIRGRIEGEILDADGEPIPLVMVDGGGNSTHSFADGSFVLENFRGEKVSVMFSHPEFRPTRVGDVPDGAAELVVRMERRQPVVILDVRHADHEAPVAHVVVTFTYPEGVTPGRQTSPHHLSETGRHAVRIPDTAIALTVAAEGHEARTIDVVAGMDGDTVVVTLPPTRAE
jgi:protocatechuate 3,4-dioxygenase beta subunit